MPDKRDERMKEITDRLQAGLEALFNSEKYTEYLRVMSQFHHYSFNNTLLIAMQKPDATLVAGYQAWEKKFKRHVMKGEKGIQIIAPAPIREKEEREKLDPVTGETILRPDGQPETEEVAVTIPRFKVSTVFDLSQTDGEPLPDLAAEELTASVENFDIFMEAIRSVSPAPIRFDEITSGAKGYYDSLAKEIVIQNGMSESQTMKTAVHETAHAKLHDRDLMDELGIQKDQMTKEVEAESVAYTVCQHFGLDTSDYSFPYIAGWSSNHEMKELRSSMDTIRRTASEVIDGIEASMREQLRARNVDRYEIYQIGEDSPIRRLMFSNREYFRAQGIAIRPENYSLVYTAPLQEGDTLDSLYTKFNNDRPPDFTGHSLSVSDVVLLHRNGEDQAFFVDSVGFAEVPEFLDQSIEKEQPEITMDSKGVSVDGHEGTWHSIEQREVNGHTFYLMEHDEFSDSVANVLVDSKGILVSQDLWNGIDHDAMQSVKEYFRMRGAPYEDFQFPLKERYLVETTVDNQDHLAVVVVDHITGGPYAENGEPIVFENKAAAKRVADRLNKEAQKIYHHMGSYAREHNELPAYRTSMLENRTCKDEIEKIIKANFDGMYLKEGIVQPVIDRFGAERVAHVLANTIQRKSWDGRFSSQNKTWAAQLPIKEDDGSRNEDVRDSFVVDSHPAILDGYVEMFRGKLRELGLEHDGTKAEEKGFIDHFYVVEDLQVKGQLAIKEYAIYEDAISAYFALPNDKLKALGVQNTNPMPGSLDLIQCRNGIDTPILDYTSVEAWNNPEIQAVVEEISQSLALHDSQIAYSMDDGFFMIQSTENGFDYSFYDQNYRLLDGGVLDMNVPGEPAKSVDEAVSDILSEKDKALEDCTVINCEGFMEKVSDAEQHREPSLSFYVAENMDYPVLGEYRECETLAEAVEVYREMAQQGNSQLGIGFNLNDGSEYAGAHQLMRDGKVVSEMITHEEYYKDSPLVLQALSDIHQYFPDERQTEYQPREAQEPEPVVEQRTAEPGPVTQQTAPEASEKTEKAPEQGSERKTSVLKALRERQAKIKAQERQEPTKQKTQERKKGEQSL